MPINRGEQLIEGIQFAIEDSGYSGGLVSAARTHPRKYVISNAEGVTIPIWVYAWTLTPGGRPQLANEYRIQMTSVVSPLALNPEGPTVLIGYEPGLKMFAGFDLRRHQTFTTGSPSVQIDIRTVRQALQDGLAFDRKSNGEIAVGIRPDQLISYVLNAEKLHRGGSNRSNFILLERAASMQPIAEADVLILPQERRRIIQTVSHLSRAANFRQQVLRAYGFRCAVTQAQLRLVDAAHVLPVGAPGSSDDVRNGIALSPTLHRAYDNGLIYLDGTYVMQTNPAKERELASQHLDGGLASLRASLGRIVLPPDRRQWPDTTLIERANRFRKIS